MFSKPLEKCRKKVCCTPKSKHGKCECDDDVFFFLVLGKLTSSSSIIMGLMRCMIYLHFHWREKKCVNFIIFVPVPVWQPPSKCSLLMHSPGFFFAPSFCLRYTSMEISLCHAIIYSNTCHGVCLHFNGAPHRRLRSVLVPMMAGWLQFDACINNLDHVSE